MNFSPASFGCPFASGDRVDIYARCSTGDQSIQSQIQFMREWFSYYRLVEGEMYADEARSGTHVAGRSDFLRMIERLRGVQKSETDRPRGVAFWDFSRFGRDFDDAQYYKADLRRMGYVLCSVTDNIPTGLAGRLIEAVKDYQNADFIEKLRHNIMRGQRDLAGQGFVAGGFPSIGYVRSEPVELGLKQNGKMRIAHRLVKDPQVSERVARAWQLKLDGCTHQEIHSQTHLFADVTQYAAFFKRVVYAGALKCGPVIKWGAHEGYVSSDQFNQVQRVRQPRAKKGDVLKHPSLHAARRSPANPYLLTGVLYCALCGKPMSGTSNGRNRLYRCDWHKRPAGLRVECAQKSINTRALHQPLLEWIAGSLLTYENLQRTREEIRALVSGEDDTLRERQATLLAERERVQVALRHLTTAIEQRGWIPTLQARWDERTTELAQIEQEIQVITAQFARGEVKVSDEGLRSLVASASDRLLHLAETHVGEIRDTVRVIVSRADLFADHMRVDYSAIPFLQSLASGKMVGNGYASSKKSHYSPHFPLKNHTILIARPKLGRPAHSRILYSGAPHV